MDEEEETLISETWPFNLRRLGENYFVNELNSTGDYDHTVFGFVNGSGLKFLLGIGVPCPRGNKADPSTSYSSKRDFISPD